jgi:hypothetical protein
LLSLPSAYGQAVTDPLGTLATAWQSVDEFATLGSCASYPLEEAAYSCSPVQLWAPREGDFAAGGFLSVSDSALSIADELGQSTVNAARIERFMSTYNYSDATVNLDVRYRGRGFVFGVRPKRLTTQLQIHNPALPFFSFILRDEIHAFAGGGYEHTWGPVSVGGGAHLSVLTREESSVETSLADLGARTLDEVVLARRLNGIFGDLALTVRLWNWVTLSNQASNVGGFWNGQTVSRTALFLYDDRAGRMNHSLSFHPPVWKGRLLLTTGLNWFWNQANLLDRQWMVSAGYLIGPARALVTYAPGLVRGLISVRMPGFTASVAQEWWNQTEPGRVSHPRIALELGIGL